MRARTHTHARVMGLAFQRIVSFPLYFPLFLPFFLLSLSLFLSLFFFGRALSSCIGSVLLIVTALGRRGREREGGEGVLWLDFENENATSRSNLAIGRCLSLLILGAGRKLAESYFHGEEREVTCLETTRWNAIRERRL